MLDTFPYHREDFSMKLYYHTYQPAFDLLSWWLWPSHAWPDIWSSIFLSPILNYPTGMWGTKRTVSGPNWPKCYLFFSDLVSFLLLCRSDLTSFDFLKNQVDLPISFLICLAFWPTDSGLLMGVWPSNSALTCLAYPWLQTQRHQPPILLEIILPWGNKITLQRPLRCVSCPYPWMCF